jgi:uncharacterized membrane protein
MRPLFLTWPLWAVFSACFAALTAIFAKIGVENVGSDFATFVRTVVIIVEPYHNHDALWRVSRVVRLRHRRVMDLLFPGTQIG